MSDHGAFAQSDTQSEQGKSNNEAEFSLNGIAKESEVGKSVGIEAVRRAHPDAIISTFA